MSRHVRRARQRWKRSPNRRTPFSPPSTSWRHWRSHSADPPLQQAIDRIKRFPPSRTAPSPPASIPFADHTLGDFRIARQVGRGGMGIVYEAEQISLGRKVAPKTLPFAGLLDPRRLQRFQNEARAAASLEHPHIVPVYAVGVDRSVYYYAMRFIDGPNLSEIIDQLRRRMRLTSGAAGNAASTATLPPALKAAVGAQTAGGSAAAPEPRQNGSDRLREPRRRWGRHRFR